MISNMNLSTFLVGFLVFLLMQTEALRIGAFNIQILGTSKYADETVMNYIDKILRRYDVVLVQEIRDISGVVIPGVLNRLQDGGEEWDVVYSERLGRTSSKEQYAYYYRSNILTASLPYQYDDSADDEFEREPFGVLFESTYTKELEKFGLLGVHIKPDDAVAEIDALPNVINMAAEFWEIEDIMLMGDLNAECSYVNIQELSELTLKIDSSYLWVIGDEVDTTTSATDCAYDRMIVTGDLLKNALDLSTAGVFRYDEAYDLDLDMTKDVSDHYPVEVEVPSDTDTTTDAADRTRSGSYTLMFTILLMFGMRIIQG